MGENVYFRFPYVSGASNWQKFPNWVGVTGLSSYGVTVIDGCGVREALPGEQYVGELIETAVVELNSYYRYPHVTGKQQFMPFNNWVEISGLRSLGVLSVDSYDVREAVAGEPYFDQPSKSLIEAVTSGNDYYVKYPKVPGEPSGTRSSVYGMGYDQLVTYDLGTQVGNEKRYFPAVSGTSKQTYGRTEYSLGLTFFSQEAEQDDFIITRDIVTPFFRTEELGDPDIKGLLGPFLYEKINITNDMSYARAVKLFAEYAGVVSQRETSGYYIVEFQGDRDGSGTRAVAIPKGLGSVSVNNSGFSYNLNLNGNQQIQLVLVHAAYTTQTILTDYNNRQFIPYYNTLFSGVDDVLAYAYSNRDTLLNRAAETEGYLSGSADISPKERFFLAQSFHSYMANTFLLVNRNATEDKRFYVSEGYDCCGFLSTVDMMYDAGVLEAYFMPWALELEIREWLTSADNSPYLTPEPPYGEYLEHDMGLFGYYEGFGQPYFKQHITSQAWLSKVRMQTEENANAALLIWYYWKATSDSKLQALLNEDGNKTDLMNLLLTMKNRDTNNNGISDVSNYTPAGCCPDCQPSTCIRHDGNTFDTAADFPHVVLGQVKDNTYLGTKQMAAYLAAAEIYSTFYANDPIFQTLPALLETEAQKIANTLITASTANNGKISLSLDPANAGRNADASVILDGLFYPALGGMDNPILNQVKDYLLNSAVMSRSNLTVANGILLNGQNYGAGEERWDQFWMSKAFGSEAVMRKMFGETSSTVGEKAFANLLRTNGAYVDSFNPLTGLETYPFKLRFYPRGVVSFGLLDIPSSGQGGGGLPEPPPLPTLGDVNNDSAVDALDYTILTDNWGENPSNPVADIDANGVVNSLDLFYVLLNWTVSSPPLSPTGYTCNSQSWQCSGTKDCTLDQDVNCVADCAVNCDGMHTACTAVSPTGGSCELVSGEGYNLCTDGSNCICFADDYPCDTDSNCCSGYCQPTGGIGFGGACVGSHL